MNAPQSSITTAYVFVAVAIIARNNWQTKVAAWAKAPTTAKAG